MNMIARRRYMGGVGLSEKSYIQDGLVFQLDGINKGTDDTTKWVDLVGGVVYTEINGNDCHEENHIKINNSYILTPNVSSNFPISTYTIETAFYANYLYWCAIAAFGNTGVGVAAKNAGMTKIGNKSYSYNSSITTGNNCISIVSGNLFAIENGIEKTLTADYMTTTYGQSLGAYTSTSNYKLRGGIYAVRVYNRLLTTDEALKNQRIDNKRFNLGLNI